MDLLLTGCSHWIQWLDVFLSGCFDNIPAEYLKGRRVSSSLVHHRGRGGDVELLPHGRQYRSLSSPVPACSALRFWEEGPRAGLLESGWTSGFRQDAAGKSKKRNSGGQASRSAPSVCLLCVCSIAVGSGLHVLLHTGRLGRQTPGLTDVLFMPVPYD